jgi:hypothetical protein
VFLGADWSVSRKLNAQCSSRFQGKHKKEKDFSMKNPKKYLVKKAITALMVMASFLLVALVPNARAMVPLAGQDGEYTTDTSMLVDNNGRPIPPFTSVSPDDLRLTTLAEQALAPGDVFWNGAKYTKKARQCKFDEGDANGYAIIINIKTGAMYYASCKNPISVKRRVQYQPQPQQYTQVEQYQEYQQPQQECSTGATSQVLGFFADLAITIVQAKYSGGGRGGYGYSDCGPRRQYRPQPQNCGRRYAAAPSHRSSRGYSRGGGGNGNIAVNTRVRSVNNNSIRITGLGGGGNRRGQSSGYRGGSGSGLVFQGNGGPRDRSMLSRSSGGGNRRMRGSSPGYRQNYERAMASNGRRSNRGNA